MNKRRLHHTSKKLSAIKPWYFLLLALISGVVCVFALRANNQHMIELRDTVYAADKNGGDVQKPLQELQEYVTTHMNTNLDAGPNAVYPPVQLKYTYERLVRQQGEKLSQSNSALYTEAQRHCEQQNPGGFSGGGRVPCIQQYIQSKSPQMALSPIPDALYKFSFHTPRWSPDLAGWSMLAAIVFAALFVISFISSRFAKR